MHLIWIVEIEDFFFFFLDKLKFWTGKKTRSLVLKKGGTRRNG